MLLRARAWLVAALADIASLVVLASAALACMWPALPTLRTQLVGDLNQHPVDASWLYLLVSRMLLERWPPSLSTPWFLDPVPLDVLEEYADIGNPALAALLVRLLGPVLAYNTMQAVLATAAGFATYALGRAVSLSRPVALVGGLFAVVMEPLWFAVRWGEDDVATLGWLAAVMTVGFRVADRHSGRALVGGLVVGAAWGLVGWFNSYYLLFLGFALPIILSGDLRRGARHMALRSAGVALGLAVVWGPRAALGYRASRQSTHYAGANWIRSFSELTTPPEIFPTSSSLDVLSLLVFNSETRLAKAQIGQGEGCLYLGLGFLALAVVGAIWGRVSGKRRLVALALVFGLFSLGPWLRDDEHLVRLGSWGGIPMPAGLVGLVFSPLRRLDHPFRFIIVTFLVLSPLAAAGVARLAALVSRHAVIQVLVALGLAGGALYERVVATPGAFPVRAGEMPRPQREYEELRYTRGAVFHAQWPLPGGPTVQLEANRFQRAMQVMVHQRPIVVDPAAAWLAGPASSAEMDTVIDGLRELGVGTIVVQRNLDGQLQRFLRVPIREGTPYATQEKWATANLTACLGAPRGGEVRMWTLKESSRCVSSPGATAPSGPDPGSG